MKSIRSFAGNYRFLSNFWPAAVIFDGHSYRTVEHAYQAAKTLSPGMRAVIRAADTPSDAKHIGRTLLVRPDFRFTEKRIEVMRDLLQQKFATEPLRSKLLATGTLELVEGNTWNDTFWGVCGGVGQNHLGKLLMEIRDVRR